MPGPPGGVRLQSGRLVVGMYGEDEAKQVQTTDYSPPATLPSCPVIRPNLGPISAALQVRSYAAFSDDHGRTWAHGSPAGTSASGPVYGGGENQIVPYGGGGTLAMFLRGRTTAADDVSHNHGLAWSSDGGAARSIASAAPRLHLGCISASLSESGATWSNASRLDMPLWRALRGCAGRPLLTPHAVK